MEVAGNRWKSLEMDGCGSKIGTPNRTLASGNMDQNLWRWQSLDLETTPTPPPPMNRAHETAWQAWKERNEELSSVQTTMDAPRKILRTHFFGGSQTQLFRECLDFNHSSLSTFGRVVRPFVGVLHR